MFGPSFFIVGVLAFICVVHQSSALTLQQANTVCALLPDGENIANPIDCSQYYSCNKGKARLNSCLGNDLFSKEAQTCVPKSEASCGSEDFDACTYMSDGYFVSVSNSCSDYYYCQDGRGTKSSCPNGLNFDEANQSCQYASDYPCTESVPGDGNINFCEVVRSGMFFGVSTSCSKWQKCESNGPLKTGNCEDGLQFNVDTQSCDYKVNVKCRQLQNNPGTGGSSLEGTTCKTNGEVKPDTTCAGYYVCTNGKYKFGKCTNGQYFNPKTTKCVSRLDAVNDCDRCEGTKKQFVNLYQDDCRGYAYCRNGKTQSVGSCSSGYFSELSESCDESGENPEYPVCYISDDSETSTEETEVPSPTKPVPSPVTDAPSTSTSTKKEDTSSTTLETSTTPEATKTTDKPSTTEVTAPAESVSTNTTDTTETTTDKET